MAKNANLRKADKVENDEFYTILDDIAAEVCNYKKHFKDKVVFCNCDDPEWSNFWQYFHMNFTEFGLKKLISTHYNKDGSPSYKMEYMGGNDADIKMWNEVKLTGDGDFRSPECVEILKEADIVVTNPPFSIAREDFIPLLFAHNKKFLIIGDLNWISYKTIFPLLKENKMWLGYNYVKSFTKPDGTEQKFGNKLWYTNLDIQKRHEELLPKLKNQFKKHPELYKKYDHYNAINVGFVKKIPYDYYEPMSGSE